INHIAAVVLPALLGIVWVFNSSAVFLIGAGIAALSLGLSQLIPDSPQPDFETKLSASQ
ncbi:MAG: MFS transporter, partial [OM182 bacterium]|nr:MFS transporter [OM182 bacterium]